MRSLRIHALVLLIAISSFTLNAVAFDAVDIDGNEVSSDIFSSSRLTMVNVWATYCNPCLAEMPYLGEIANEYDKSDFTLIGIISDVDQNSNERRIQYARFLVQATKADYVHLLLNKDLYNALLKGVSVVPTTFFIDSDENVIDTVLGSKSKSDWKAKIDALLSSL